MHWYWYLLLLASLPGSHSALPYPDVFIPDFRRAEDPECRHQGIAYLEALESYSLWAAQMFDASAKLPTGLLVSNGYELGSFDECLSARGRYCLARLTFIPNATLQALHSNLGTVWSKITDTHDPRQVRRDGVWWGLCAPAACTSADLERALQASVTSLQNHVSTITVQISPESCQTEESILQRKQLTSADILVLCGFVFLVALVLMATIYDTYWNNETNNVTFLLQLLLCFSALRSIAILRNGELSNTGFDCIHGTRLVSTLIAILFHRFYYTLLGAVADTTMIEQGYQQWMSMPLANGSSMVATFFVYSGLLTAYYLPQELRKRKINPITVWVFRFIRLTPLYLVALVFRATLLRNIGSGPLWPHTIGLEHRRCAQNWLLNLFYVNNFINPDQMCFYHSWYLAADIHLFMVTVVIIYFLCRRPILGYILLSVFVMLSVILPFAKVFYENADPLLLVYPHVLQDWPASQYFRDVYIQSHLNAGPYAVAVFGGYVLYLIKDVKFTIPKPIVYLGHSISILLCTAVLFSAHAFYDPTTSRHILLSAVYAALRQPLWALGITINIFLLVRGRIDWLHKALTWSPLIPLSRLSYSAYLVHTLPQLYERAIIRTPSTLSFFTTFWMYCGDLVFTFSFSLVLSILVESPFRAIEKLLLGSRNSSSSKGVQKKIE